MNQTLYILLAIMLASWIVRCALWWTEPTHPEWEDDTASVTVGRQRVEKPGRDDVF